jgi:hypothetical protein
MADSDVAAAAAIAAAEPGSAAAVAHVIATGLKVLMMSRSSFFITQRAASIL